MSLPLLGGPSVSQYPREPIQVFCSYAPQDKFLRDKLETQLSTFKRSGLMTVWHNQEIAAGMDWKQQIDTQINLADIILLLLSADFMASDYCYGQEMHLSIERHKRGEAHVFPILLRPVHLEGTPLAELWMLPRDEGGPVPITQWADEDKVLYNVANDIQKQAIILRNEKVRNSWVQEGKCQTEAGEYSKAERAYAEVLRLFPNHGENGIIYQYRADLLRRLGPAHYEEAKKMYVTALNLGSLESSTYHHFGDILAGLSEYKLALNAYELAARADPQNIQLLQKQGDMFSKLEQYDKALTLYNKALEIDSTQVILYLSKGYVLRCLQRYENAFDAYKEAIEYDPANAVLWVLKGTTLCEMKDYSSAVKAYEYALTIDPTLALAHYGKAFARIHHSPTLRLRIGIGGRRYQEYEDAKLFGYSDLFLQGRDLFSFDTKHVYCSKKHENWYGARFCNECQEKLQSNSTFPCPECGLPVGKNNKYCSNCGHAFSGSLLK